jgi:hypothetical protein
LLGELEPEPLLDDPEEPEPEPEEPDPEPLLGELEPEPPLDDPEPEPELEPEPWPGDPEPEVGADTGTNVDVAPFFVVPAPFVLLALTGELELTATGVLVLPAADVLVLPAAGVLVAAPAPVAVTGGPTGSPIWVELSPVYTYTGERSAGVTGATRFVDRPLSGTTGLFPGSAGRVPVAISSTPLVMRQVPPFLKVKYPAVEQQVGSPKAALVH